MENRRASRRRVLLTGRIVHGGGAFSMPGTIRNLSATGAMVAVADSACLPPELYVIEVRAGEVWRARVAWRKPGFIGVAFEERYAAESLADTEFKYLHTLWIEACDR